MIQIQRLPLQIFILLILIITSCVSLKPAKTFDKAENKVIKLNKGIQNQIERYPSLINKSYTYTVTDTLYIPESSTEFKASLLKIDSLLNEIDKYDSFITDRDRFIDSLMNTPLSEFPKECQEIVNEFNTRNNILTKELTLRNKELTKVFNKYQEELTKRISGTYEDDIFKVDYEFYNGDILIKPTVKDRWELYEKSIVTNSISIRKHFYQDIKFWIFLIGLLSVFYYFNNLVYNLIDSIFTAIKYFIKRLFTKL